MTPQKRWTLTVMASHDDGAELLFQPVSGVHAHVRQLLDSDMALVEFTLVVSRSQAEELQYALSIDESVQPEANRWLFLPNN